MKIEAFKSGHFEKGIGYKYFVPTKINEQWQWDNPELNTLLEEAAVKLGELNSFSKLVPNIDLFIQLHVTKEAVVSSRIEGTQTNMNEALLPEEEILPERKTDWQEVKNYIDAMNNAIKELEHLPISSRLFKQTHKTLLSNVRGEHKLPGEFRTSQNWIGGASLDDASFIPPNQQYVEELMGDLENFLHNDDIKVPDLIAIGLAHYQFETIHPFLDGNGRIGRLLITLYLVSKGILSSPLLYLSTYFEKNKNLYYDRLDRVRSHNELMQWLKYFLVGIRDTSTQAAQTLHEIINLKSKLENEIQQNFGRKGNNAIRLLNILFERPVISVNELEKYWDLSYKSSNELVKDFEKHGYLENMFKQTRNRLFLFKPYLKLFESDN